MRAILRQVVSVGLLVALGSGCSMLQDRRHATAQTQRATAQTKKVDLNTAGRRELERLPGLTTADVDQIIVSRPYAKKHELLDRRVLEERKFNGIRDDVAVSQRGM